MGRKEKLSQIYGDASKSLFETLIKKLKKPAEKSNEAMALHTTIPITSRRKFRTKIEGLPNHMYHSGRQSTYRYAMK